MFNLFFSSPSSGQWLLISEIDWNEYTMIRGIKLVKPFELLLSPSVVPQKTVSSAEHGGA